MGLNLVEQDLDFPPLVVRSGEVGRGRVLVIEQGRDQTDDLAAGTVVDLIFDDSDRDFVVSIRRLLPRLISLRIDLGATDDRYEPSGRASYTGRSKRAFTRHNICAPCSWAAFQNS